jgi:hypothetical protein
MNDIALLKKESPDLERILRDAPKDVSYEPHNNGFYLRNEAIKLQYTQISASRDNIVALWFLQTQPKIGVSSSFVDMEDLPDSLRCTHICAHIGNTNVFTFPAEEGGNTISIDRYPFSGDGPEGDESWYEKGTQLLRQAARKYDLQQWYNQYIGKASSAPRLTLRRRALKLIGFG